VAVSCSRLLGGGVTIARMWLAAVCLVLSIGLPCVASADVVYVPTLEDDARGAVRIARVQISARQEVKYSDGARTIVCGCRYRAHVREALKGNTSDFEFFSTVVSPDESAEHVVLVYELTEKQRSDFRQKVEGLRKELQQPGLCRLGDSARYRAYSIMAFDERAEKEFGREWLRPLEPLASAADLARRRPAGVDYEVVSWDLARQTILGVISK